MTLAKRDPRQRGLLTLWIIWAALLASLLVYVFIGGQFGEEIRRAQGSNLPVGLFRNLMYMVAAVVLFLAHFLRKLMLSARFNGAAGKVLETGAGWSQSALLGRYTIATIVSLALAESIGIFGLVLFLLGDSIQTFYIFVSIAAAALFYYRPKREEIESLANATDLQGPSASDL